MHNAIGFMVAARANRPNEKIVPLPSPLCEEVISGVPLLEAKIRELENEVKSLNIVLKTRETQIEELVEELKEAEEELSAK